jgi:hypothetical protein
VNECGTIKYPQAVHPTMWVWLIGIEKYEVKLRYVLEEKFEWLLIVFLGKGTEALQDQRMKQVMHNDMH